MRARNPELQAQDATATDLKLQCGRAHASAESQRRMEQGWPRYHSFNVAALMRARNLLARSRCSAPMRSSFNVAALMRARNLYPEWRLERDGRRFNVAALMRARNLLVFACLSGCATQRFNV